MRKIIVITVLSISNLIFGQTTNPNPNSNQTEKYSRLPEILSPSPDVASLMKLEEVPINHYSGKPNISIPLYAKNFLGLDFNLTLNYDSSGLRVDEGKSWVGTGWSLNEGGVISRTVVGIPDETNTTGSMGVFHNNYFNFQNLSQYEQSKLVWSSQFGIEKRDTNMDVFQYNLLGRTGRFSIIKNNIGQLVPKIIGEDQKIKINLIYDTNYDISKFTVIDEKGLIYTFDKIEFSNSVPAFSLLSQFSNYRRTEVHSVVGITFKSAWKLSKVETPNGVVICEFEYTTSVHSNPTPGNTTLSRLVNNGDYTYLNSIEYPLARTYNDNVVKPRIYTSYNSLTHSSPSVQRITFYDSTQVLFSTSINILTGFNLNSISIIDNGISKVFNFNYEVNNLEFKRPFLMSIDNVQGTDAMSYSFDYYNKEILTGFESTKKDVFGYYNGNDFKNSNKEHLKAGVLTKITYPTGGVKEFDFEPNTYGFIAGRQLSKEELFDNSDNRVPLLAQKDFSTNVESSNYNDSEQSIIIVYISQDQTGELISTIISGDTTYLNGCLIDVIPKKLLPGLNYNPEGGLNPQFLISDFQDDFLRQGVGMPLDIQNSRTYDIELQRGFYFVKFYVPNQLVNLNSPNGNIAVNLKLKHAKLKSGPLSKFLFGDGLRIKQIKFTDHTISKQKVVYGYEIVESNPLDLIEGTLSSGSIDLYSLKNKYIINKTDRLMLNFGCDQFNLPITYEVTEVSNPLSAQLTKGTYVGYKNVTFSTIDENTQTTLGKTVNTYTSPIDFSLYPPLYGYPFPPVPDLDHKRGNLIKSEIFNTANQLLKRTVNEYDFVTENVLQYLYVSENIDQICPYDRFFERYDDALTSSVTINPVCTVEPSSGNEFQIFFDGYAPNCQLVNTFSAYPYLTTGNTFLSKVEEDEYFYSNNGMQSTRTTQTFDYNLENYQINKQTKKYFEGTTEVVLEVDNSYPVGSVGNTAELTSAESSAVSKLIQLNKINEVLHTITKRNGQAIYSNAFTFEEFSPNLVLPKRVLSSKNAANPAGGMSGYSEPFYTNYKFERYDLYGNPLQLRKENGIPLCYIWAYNNTQVVAKIENIAYTEIPTSLITAIQNATNSATSTETQVLTALQALRNAPALATAMITTLTYKPSVGVTTVTDPKGMKTTYEYDSFGRLQTVKDQFGNKLSENDYHYRTQN